MEEKTWVRLFWVLLILLIIYKIAVLLGPYMLSIQGSVIFAVLTYPLYNWFYKKTKKRNTSAILVITCLIILVLVPFSLITVGLANQTASIIVVDDEYVDSIEQGLLMIGIDIDFQTEGLQIIKQAKQVIFDNLLTILNKATALVINLFIFFFLMFYLLLFGPEVVNFVKRYLPFDKKKNQEFLLESARIVKAVVYGAILTAFIQGALGGIGFGIFGIGRPLFWGFVMALFSLLPVVGSWIIWAPAAIYLLLSGQAGLAIGLAIWGFLIVSQSDNLIKPWITSKLGKVHPVVIILGVFVGIGLFGVIGLISGPILLGLLVLMIQYFHNEENIVVHPHKKKKKWYNFFKK